jgi:hypothetical protein
MVPRMGNPLGLNMGITTGNYMEPRMGIAMGNRMVLSMELRMGNITGFRTGINMDKTTGLKMERHSFTLSTIDLSYARRVIIPHQVPSNMPCFF